MRRLAGFVALLGMLLAFVGARTSSSIADEGRDGPWRPAVVSGLEGPEGTLFPHRGLSRNPAADAALARVERRVVGGRVLDVQAYVPWSERIAGAPLPAIGSLVEVELFDPLTLERVAGGAPAAADEVLAAPPGGTCADGA